MPDYNLLEYKTEVAFSVVIAAYVGAAVDPIYLAQDAREVQVPSSVVQATLGPEVQMGTGIRWVFVTVTTRSPADKVEDDDDPPADHNARVVKVRDACLQDGIVALLNAAGVTEFTVIDVYADGPTPTSHDTDGENRWLTDSLQMRVVAAAASI